MKTYWKQSFYLSSSKGRGHKQADGTYPIKLRVWAGHLGKAGMYNTGFYANKKDFESSMSLNPRGRNLVLKEQLMEYYSKVAEIFKNESVFTLRQFAHELKPRANKELSVVVWDFMENQMLPGYTKKSTITSIKEGIKHLKNFNSKLSFFDFNVRRVRKFQKYMLELGLSQSTCNIYLKYLRICFNMAIGKKIIIRDFYPFGMERDGKFSIKVPQTEKDSLTIDEIEMLKKYNPIRKKGAPYNVLEKTRDLFLFSYYCGGANYIDIMNLKWENISKDKTEFTFRRTKTKDTGNLNITVRITDAMKEIIGKWAVKQSPFVFGLITLESNVYNRNKKQAGKLNQRLKEIAKELKFRPIVQEKISMLWARHTFATVLDRKNYSLKEIGSLMGHASVTTTENYIGSLKKEESLKMQNDL